MSNHKGEVYTDNSVSDQIKARNAQSMQPVKSKGNDLIEKLSKKSKLD